MPTVNSTAGADSAASSSRCRPSPAASAPSPIAALSPAAIVLFLGNQRAERPVGIGAGLVDALLLQDQILHRLADELARFRVCNDGIADFGRTLCRQNIQRSLPLFAHRLLLDPFAVVGIARHR